RQRLSRSRAVSAFAVGPARSHVVGGARSPTAKGGILSRHIGGWLQTFFRQDYRAVLPLRSECACESTRLAVDRDRPVQRSMRMNTDVGRNALHGDRGALDRLRQRVEAVDR